jgi:hypothetical protein
LVAYIVVVKPTQTTIDLASVKLPGKSYPALANSFKSATVLLEKLQGMQRHRAIRESGPQRERFSRYVAKLCEAIGSTAPVEAVEPATKTLESWLGQ